MEPLVMWHAMVTDVVACGPMCTEPMHANSMFIALVHATLVVSASGRQRIPTMLAS
jgi:hypothetical protein